MRRRLVVALSFAIAIALELVLESSSADVWDLRLIFLTRIVLVLHDRLAAPYHLGSVRHRSIALRFVSRISYLRGWTHPILILSTRLSTLSTIRTTLDGFICCISDSPTSACLAHRLPDFSFLPIMSLTHCPLRHLVVLPGVGVIFPPDHLAPIRNPPVDLTSARRRRRLVPTFLFRVLASSSSPPLPLILGPHKRRVPCSSTKPSSSGTKRSRLSSTSSPSPRASSKSPRQRSRSSRPLLTRGRRTAPPGRTWRGRSSCSRRSWIRPRRT